MDKPNNASAVPPDFSEPWKFSDVMFHVHRSTLAFWSPVFERMFTSDFKEKNSDEIPLPGKRAGEFKELLQMMYPSLEEKVISRNNCYFLLDLAREYQISSITRKCEDFLVSAVETRTESHVLAVLIIGQNYELQTLINSCVFEARRLSLKELKHHTKRGEIDPDNYLQIAEGIIERLEEQGSEVKTSCSQKLLILSRSLYYHATQKTTRLRFPSGLDYITYPNNLTIDDFLFALNGDKSEYKFGSPSKSVCPGLSEVSKHLTELKAILETLP